MTVIGIAPSRSMPHRRGGPEGNHMLSKEDNRRLAQLERQLQRDDPDFCARMGGGNFSVSTATARPALPLFVLAALIILVAAALGTVGWWIASGVTATWAAVTLAAATYRSWRSRP